MDSNHYMAELARQLGVPLAAMPQLTARWRYLAFGR